MRCEALRPSSIAAALGLALIAVMPAWAQSTATLQGTVTDPQGAVLPGVQITLRSQETGVERNTLTDSAGHYLVPSLAVGTYRLEARLSGFQPRIVTNIRVQVAETVAQNF